MPLPNDQSSRQENLCSSRHMHNTHNFKLCAPVYLNVFFYFLWQGQSVLFSLDLVLDRLFPVCLLYLHAFKSKVKCKVGKVGNLYTVYTQRGELVTNGMITVFYTNLTRSVKLKCGQGDHSQRIIWMTGEACWLLQI